MNKKLSILAVMFLMLFSSPVLAQALLVSPNTQAIILRSNHGASAYHSAPSTVSKFELEIARQAGLYLRREGDETQYLARLGTAELLLHSAPGVNDPEAAEKVSQELCRKAAQKTEDLIRRFSITISDEEPIRYAAKSSTVEQYTLIKTRKPTLGELCSLEYALERSLKDGANSQLQVIFAASTYTHGALAKWELSSKNRPTIIIEPRAPHFEEGLEYVLLHELGHHSEYKLGYDPSNPYGWKLINSLGWSTFTNSATGESDWSITTKDGMQFKYSMTLRTWVSCNKNGQPVDQFGRRVKHQYEAVCLSSETVIENAKIRPATRYIDNPLEVLAEGLAMYRLNETQRARLLERSPELYKIVQDFDQKALDKYFGPDMFRAADGRVVSKTDVIAAKAVNELEKGLGANEMTSSRIIARQPSP